MRKNILYEVTQVAQKALDARQAEIEQLRAECGKLANSNLVYANALFQIAVLNHEHGACTAETLETLIDEMQAIARKAIKQ